MKIKSSLKEYSVYFEHNLDFLKELIHTPNAQFVVDKNVYQLYPEQFSGVRDERLITIEASEQNKNIETALKICEKMTGISAKRNAVIISVGGGIIQDITGFAANILYRGVKWIFVPTTLLAACDSCIGGKTSLNFNSYKNLLGTFYPPDEIHISSQFFESLTDRDYKSGLGEVIKFNIMAGQAGLDKISLAIDKLLQRGGGLIVGFMESSLNFKKGFIEQDEFDRGERVKLNFAHTFGHAIEVVSKYEIPHGTAVAIGMIMANRVSFERGLLSSKTMSAAEAVLMKVIKVDIACLDLPLEKIIDAMKRDKKANSSSTNITAVLMTDCSQMENLVIVNDLTTTEIDNAVNYFKKLYSNEGQRE